MMHDRTDSESLEDAVTREGEAAASLAQHLRETRWNAAQLTKSDRMATAVLEAKKLADALNQRGSVRLRLTSEIAQALGLPAKSSLAAVAETLGERPTFNLAVARLHDRLGALARESAALRFFARQGAAVAAHLAELAMARTVYGPKAAERPVRPDTGFAV
jgi:hypothetical protein